MQNKHQFFFLVLGVPTLGEGGGSTWLGQIPKFFQKFDLKAPLSRQATYPITNRPEKWRYWWHMHDTWPPSFTIPPQSFWLPWMAMNCNSRFKVTPFPGSNHQPKISRHTHRANHSFLLNAFSASSQFLICKFNYIYLVPMWKLYREIDRNIISSTKVFDRE